MNTLPLTQEEISRLDNLKSKLSKVPAKKSKATKPPVEVAPPPLEAMPSYPSASIKQLDIPLQLPHKPATIEAKDVMPLLNAKFDQAAFIALQNEVQSIKLQLNNLTKYLKSLP